MEKISWTENVRNEELLLRFKEQRNILHEISKRKANWIGHILRSNCLLQRVIEGKIKGRIEVTERRGWRRRKLLDDLKGRRGYSLLKEEALDRSMWRVRFGRGFGPVVRQTAEWMNIALYRLLEKQKCTRYILVDETNFGFIIYSIKVHSSLQMCLFILLHHRWLPETSWHDWRGNTWTCTAVCIILLFPWSTYKQSGDKMVPPRS